MRPALADDLGDLVLAVVEFFGERRIAVRLFERIEIGALHVLDDRDLERLLVAHLDQDHRHIVHTPALRAARQRRPPATISYWSMAPRALRIRIGWMMPRSRIEAASSSSSASANTRRGLRGFGLTNSIGTRR